MEEPIKAGDICLNLGCGNKIWPHWVNIDMPGTNAPFCADLRSLPFKENTVDRMIAVHVLEHFYLWEVKDLLQHWYKILKPGGILILELPCMDKVFNYIAKKINSGQPIQSYITQFAFWGDPRYKSIPMTHKWGYFSKELCKLVENSGFDRVNLAPPRYHFAERDMRVEARKPA